MRIVLPMSASAFVVPRNVFLVGTMNTADRSISLLDAALRRRFGFVELMPDSSQLAGRKAGGLPLGAWLDALNARLRKQLGISSSVIRREPGSSSRSPRRRLGLSSLLRSKRLSFPV